MNPASGRTFEWEDVLEEDGISSHFVNGYYPLKRNRLQAKGYKLVDWDMYYYRKANNEEGKRLSGPYKYRFRSDGTFSDGYGIRKTRVRSSRAFPGASAHR